MTNALTFIIAIVVVLAIAKFIFHVGLKVIFGLIINAVVGFVVLWLINLTGLLTIPINIVTCLVTGILGIPGIILLIILHVVGMI